MIRKKDYEIISSLRNNARESLVKIAKDIGKPPSTIYDRVRANSKVVKKFTAILDFAKVGFGAHILFAIKVEWDFKNKLYDLLIDHPNVNALYQISGYDYMVEGLFRNLMDVEDFLSQIEQNFQILQLNKFTILKELKRESILTKPEHFEILEGKDECKHS